MDRAVNDDYDVGGVLVGGLQAVAELLSRDAEVSASDTCSAFSVTLRRYACMTLTNLTYADSTNKTLLCAMPIVLRALVSQLRSSEEDLRQVTLMCLCALSH